MQNQIQKMSKYIFRGCGFKKQVGHIARIIIK